MSTIQNKKIVGKSVNSHETSAFSLAGLNGMFLFHKRTATEKSK